MYSIYADGLLIFTDEEDDEEYRLINPKLKLSAGAAGSLEFTIPTTNVGYDSIIRMKTVVTVRRNNEEIWEGRAITEKTDFQNNKVCTCEGELAYLNDTTQPQAEYHEVTVRGFLQTLIRNHNQKASSDKQFEIGAVTVEDSNNSLYRYTNYESTLNCINDKLVSRLGGHLRVRKQDGTRYLDYLKEYPKSATQEINFGDNLLDFTRSYDMSEFATVIVPLGERLEVSEIEALEAYLTVASVNDGSPYIINQAGVSLYGWIEKIVHWDDVSDPSNLLRKGQQYLADIQFDNMKLEVSALDKSYLTGNDAPIDLLDEIHCVSEPHGLDKWFPVTGIDMDLAMPQNTVYKLGTEEKVSLTSERSRANSEILKKIESIPTRQSLLEDAKKNATEIMKMATNGYVTTVVENGQATELVIANHSDILKASKLWRWNLNGLGYSKNGYNGDYGLAITMDGAIVADYITTGTLLADLIRTGILSDAKGYNYWNLDTGEFKLSWNTEIGDKLMADAIASSTRAILDNANAYGLGWKVNYNEFEDANDGECYYHGFAEDGKAADVNGWVQWNGEKVTIPKGCHVNPNDTMPFDSTIYSVYRKTNQSFHDVAWNDEANQWEANTYNGLTPSERGGWVWDESSDIVLASYSLASSESAIYAAQLFTPPKKYSELPEKVQGAVSGDIANVYAKTGGRNYLVGTGVPFESYFNTVNNADSATTSYETRQAYATYLGQSLGKLGFKVGDEFTLSFDWEAIKHNEIPYPYYHTTRTYNGITWTDNGDGTVTANGTATSDSDFIVKHWSSGGWILPVGNYKLKGCPSGGGSSTYYSFIYHKSSETGSSSPYRYDYGDGVNYECTDATAGTTVILRIKSGTTVDNLKFEPEIVQIDNYGNFRLEAYKNPYTKIQSIPASDGIITPSISDTSAHKEFVISMNSELLEMSQLVVRTDKVRGSIRLTNVKLEKGNQASDWTNAPEDLSLASGGKNLLRGTNIFTQILPTSQDAWGNGQWISESLGVSHGTYTPIDISDESIKRIARGVQIKADEDFGYRAASAMQLAIRIRQTQIPSLLTYKIYTLSCYVRGRGVFTAMLGNSLNVGKNVFVDSIGKWSRFSFPIYLPDQTGYLTTEGKSAVNIGVKCGYGDGLQICGMKLEEGLGASEWSAAPEDIDDEIASYAESIGDQIDGKAETWYQGFDPSTEWTSEELKLAHSGDLWYNSTATVQKYYRWSGSAWEEVRSNPPAEVFDTIDGKAQVFTSTPTPPYAVGDLWFNSATSDIMTCITSRDSGTYDESEWAKRNKYTDDSLATTVQKMVKSTYGICQTAPATVNKVVPLSGFTLYTGAKIVVRFTYANTAASPALNVNLTGAKPIWARGAQITSTYYWTSNSTHAFIYDGSHWVMENAESQEEVFKRLTNNGNNAGLYLENGALYINANYIHAGKLSADYVEGGIFKVGGTNYSAIEAYDDSDEQYAKLDRYGFNMYAKDSSSRTLLLDLDAGDGFGIQRQSTILLALFVRNIKYGGNDVVLESDSGDVHLMPKVNGRAYVDHRSSADSYNPYAIVGSSYNNDWTSNRAIRQIYYTGSSGHDFVAFEPYSGTTYYATMTTSDEKLKENIRDAEDVGLKAIERIEHKSFDWKDGGYRRECGYIAQQLHECIPYSTVEVPERDENGNLVGKTLQVVDHEILVYATKAIQELSAKVKSLEERLDKLNAD